MKKFTRIPFSNIFIVAISLLLLISCQDTQDSDDQKVVNTTVTQEISPESSEESNKKINTFKQYSAEDFFKTTSVFGSSINHDATAVLISNDQTGIFNAYKVPLDGSNPVQLTDSSTDTIYANSWFPKDDRILYQSDQGGDENTHVYVRELDGKTQDLTQGEKLKANFSGWHHDDQQFYITTNERDEKYFDLYLYRTEDYSRKMIYQNNGGYNIGTISEGDKWLTLEKTNGNADSDIYLVDLTAQNRTEELITKHQGDISHGTYSFTRDSKKLIYATNEFGEFNQAWSYNLEDKTKKMYFKADWDVSFVYFSKDGKYQVSGVNQDAQTKIQVLDTTTGNTVKLPNMPSGDLRGVNFSKDSSKMVFYINSDTSPSNLYVHTMGTDSIKRLTNSGNPDISEENLVVGEVVRFMSFDGLEIPCILYKPKQAETKKVPALIFVHGGPGGQSRKGYSAMIQHLVNNGYGICRINNRGSSGYGKTFNHLDDKRHGEDDLQDVVYNKKYLQSLDWVDADKIGVMGGSYGGYMTMAAMAFTDEFKVGINIFGVTNWVRTLKSIPPYWEAFRKSLYDELGDPATDEERLHRISPVFFGHQVKSPVLVVQGVNDPRVLKIESDEMVESIRSGGTHVEYLLFDDEGHGFSKKKNRIEASNKYLQFLDEYLKK